MASEVQNGAELLVDSLKNLGVKTVFAISGAGNLAILDAILRDNDIKIIYSHHEQAAVMEAQGYARVSNSLGVAIVTTGGGTSNTVTGILSAHLDSIPILIISGNENSLHCQNNNNLRAYGVQGFDSVAVLSPICKMSKRITEANVITELIYEAFDVATSGRKGPVHIDFPMDLQRKIARKLEKENPIRKKQIPNSIKDDTYMYLANLLKNSKKPILYIGNGCRNNEAIKVINNIIDDFKLPFLLTWSAVDLFPEDNPYLIGRIGIYGDRACNILVQKADLIICLGTRLAIPQIGYDKLDFGRQAIKVVIDIDKQELSKFHGLDWILIHGDVTQALPRLHSALSKIELDSYDYWHSEIKRVWAKLPRKDQVKEKTNENNKFIHSGDVIMALNKAMDGDAIISTDVGAALLSGHYLYEKRGSQRFFTSQGLGEMGFGLPAAIGAFFSKPENQIISLNTDGAIMFNLQELQLIKHHSIPLKLFIFNNSGYSMIKISQRNLFEGRFTGSSIDGDISFPDFKLVAQTFGFRYVKIQSKKDLTKLEEFLFDPAPVLFDIVMDPNQRYLPRLSTAKLDDGSLVSPPIEDLEPLIPIELLEELLGYKPKDSSMRARQAIKSE